MAILLSILIFTLFTIIYYSVLYSVGNNSPYTKLLSIIYYGSVLISQIIININVMKKLCGNNGIGKTLLVTLLPWGIIMGLINILLLIFPVWKEPFSNTFGYFITKHILGIKPFLQNDILRKSSSSKVLEAIKHIYNDPSLLINEISINDINNPSWWKSMQGRIFMTSITSEAKQKLANIIRLKDLISEAIWIILTGIYASMTCNNSIITSGCQQSVQKMKEFHAKYEKQQQQQKQQQNQNEPKPNNYYSDD